MSDQQAAWQAYLDQLSEDCVSLDDTLHRDAFMAGRRSLAARSVQVERPDEDRLKIALMERDWLLGAWAAACGIPQAEAEAEMLAWSVKWRENALAARLPEQPDEETLRACLHNALQAMASVAGRLRVIAPEIADEELSSEVQEDGNLLAALCPPTRRALETTGPARLPERPDEGQAHDYHLSDWPPVYEAMKRKLYQLGLASGDEAVANGRVEALCAVVAPSACPADEGITDALVDAHIVAERNLIRRQLEKPDVAGIEELGLTPGELASSREQTRIVLEATFAG